METFDYLIVGDEPAGLWLLKYLAEELDILQPRPRIGWLSLGRARREVLMTRTLADIFQIAHSATYFSPEFVCPDRIIDWRSGSLQRRFGSLSPELLKNLQESFFGPIRGRNQSALRYALSQSPELLGIAQGLWKVLGRSKATQPEFLLAHACLATEFFWWDPAVNLPSSVERLRTVYSEPVVEQLRMVQGKEISLSFAGTPPLRARHWIFNASLGELITLTTRCPELAVSLELSARLRQLDFTSYYWFRLRAARPAVPAPVRPFTLLLDTNEIPDPHSDIWPLFLKRGDTEHELAVMVGGPTQTSLEKIHETFRLTLKRLNRVFPFLPQHLIEIQTPLALESCFSAEQRTRALTLLERERMERYAISNLSPRGRHKGVSLLSPSLNCQLPYPAGPLSAAKTLFEEIKKRYRKPLKAALKNPRPAAHA